MKVRFGIPPKRGCRGNGMRTQSLDTSPEFEQIQIARIRTFSAAKKFASVCSWTQSITSANLSSSFASCTDTGRRDQAIAFVAREYGEPLASLFCNALEKLTEWQLQAPDIQEAFLPLLDGAEQLNVPSPLIGSVAGSIYGFPRSVQDIDIFADFSSQHLPFLIDHLAQSYIFDPHDIVQAVQQHTAFSIMHLSRLIKIDVFLPSTAFDKTAVKRRQAYMLVEGREPFFIASPEDVVLLQLCQYHRQGNNPDDRWNDILGILKVQAPTVDTAYLEQQANALGLEIFLSQALIDAGICESEPVSTL
jgi:hypothetical protein